MTVAAVPDAVTEAALLGHVEGRAGAYFPELGRIESARVLLRRRRAYSTVIHVRLTDRTALRRDVVIKVARTVERQFTALAEAWPGFMSEPDLKVPRPLEFIPEGPALVMERVAGRPLLELVPRVLWSRRNIEAAERHCTSGGRWLRFYHDTVGRGPERTLERDEKWRLLLEALEELARQGADRSRLAGLTGRLQDVAEEAFAQPRPVATLHGDFTVKNVLIGAEATTGIDLWATHSHVVDHDIASFLNSLVLLRVTRPAPAAAIARLRRAFLSGYHGAPVDAGAVALFLRAMGLADAALEILRRRTAPAMRAWVLRAVLTAMEATLEERPPARTSTRTRPGWAPADTLFVCPACRKPLTREAALTCPACGVRYLARDGTPCFNDRGVYHGPIPPKPEMQRVLELARSTGYRTVLDGHLRAIDPGLVRYLTDTGRAEGLSLLQLDGTERVLDFGCSFGLLSRRLAASAAEVVALDVTHEKLQFLEIVISQDGVKNVVPVCNGDPIRLPFSDGYFDWVVLNAVFEYLPQAVGDPDARRGHLAALQELRRIVRPGGRIYIATKNRVSYGALLGGRLHQLLPRRLARRLFRGRGLRDPSRHTIYGLRGYRRLFRDAGFTTTGVHWATPSLWYPKQFVSLSADRATMLRDVQAVAGAGPVKRAFWRSLARTGLLPYLAPNYFFIVTRG